MLHEGFDRRYFCRRRLVRDDTCLIHKSLLEERDNQTHTGIGVKLVLQG
jgi:hypothetical protein